MSTVPVRRIDDSWKLMIVALQKKRDWNGIEYNGKDSDTYKQITSWCDVTKDLVHVENGIKATKNGIMYDVASGSFIHGNWEGYVDFAFGNVFPKEISRHVQIQTDIEFVHEETFPFDILDALERAGAISKRIDVPVNLVRQN